MRMPSNQNGLKFKTLDLSLTPHPVSGNLIPLEGIDDINQALTVLLQTNFFERSFDPLVGGNVGNLLFGLNKIGETSIIQQQVENCIRNFEPRVQLSKLDVEILNDNSISINIKYYIVNSANEQVFSMILARVR